jgi:predicted nucleic acid-binding protein
MASSVRASRACPSQSARRRVAGQAIGESLEATTLPPGLRSLHARAVLIDTGALIALADSSDGKHAEARECLDGIIIRSLSVLISIPTIYETHRRILYRQGGARARQFLNAVFDGSMTVLRTEAADESEAVELVRKYADVSLTLTDAVNMTLMVRYGIGSAFSFDSDFRVVGFLCVPPLLS